MFTPSKNISPFVGSISLMMVRPKVVFPEPDSPTRPIVSPFLIEMETPSTALTFAIVRPKSPPFIGNHLKTFRASTKLIDSNSPRVESVIVPKKFSLRTESMLLYDRARTLSGEACSYDNVQKPWGILDGIYNLKEDLSDLEQNLVLVRDFPSQYRDGELPQTIQLYKDARGS